MGQIDMRTSVGQLVVEQPGRSRLFERLGIDYCCAGKLPLDRACSRAGFDVAEVLAQLATHDEAGDDEPNLANLSMCELADHIEETHHIYLRRELPRLSQMIDKVVEAHASTYLWLIDVQEVFVELVAELEMHMMKEERILFPMIRELEGAQSLPSFHCGSIGNPIAAMEHEHDNAGDALAKLRQLSGDFTPPENACNTFRVLLAGLAELEIDLHKHIHKENNILFVHASQIESRLQASGGVHS